MPVSRPNSAYLAGVRDGLPFMLIVAPFGLVFGVVALEAGLTLAETMGFTMLVIAGASQMAALHLMSEHAPLLVIVATALAVNLRMAMYSAALAVHLGPAPLWKRATVAYLNFDQTFAQSVARYEAEPDMTVSQKVAYFLGVATPIAPTWSIATLVGAMAGRSFPDWLALDFAVPITFLAIIAPMLKSAAHVAAAATSVMLALVLAWIPYNAGLLIAGLAAMLVGAGVETALARRA